MLPDGLDVINVSARWGYVWWVLRWDALPIMELQYKGFFFFFSQVLFLPLSCLPSILFPLSHTFNRTKPGWIWCYTSRVALWCKFPVLLAFSSHFMRKNLPDLCCFCCHGSDLAACCHLGPTKEMWIFGKAVVSAFFFLSGVNVESADRVQSWLWSTQQGILLWILNCPYDYEFLVKNFKWSHRVKSNWKISFCTLFCCSIVY